MTVVELLGLMVGARRAEQLLRDSGGSIRPLLLEPPVLFCEESCVNLFRLRVARELVRRSLYEDLRYGDALNSPQAVRDYLRLNLMGREHEVFMVLFLDARNRLIEAEEMFRGTLTQTSVYPREVVKRSLYFNAASVLFAHNHPSGLAEPSHSDEMLTRALREALALVDVKVLDHLVVGSTAVVSMAEKGML